MPDAPLQWIDWSERLDAIAKARADLEGPAGEMLRAHRASRQYVGDLMAINLSHGRARQGMVVVVQQSLKVAAIISRSQPDTRARLARSCGATPQMVSRYLCLAHDFPTFVRKSRRRRGLVSFDEALAVLRTLRDEAPILSDLMGNLL